MKTLITVVIVIAILNGLWATLMVALYLWRNNSGYSSITSWKIISILQVVIVINLLLCFCLLFGRFVIHLK